MSKCLHHLLIPAKMRLLYTVSSINTLYKKSMFSPLWFENMLLLSLYEINLSFARQIDLKTQTYPQSTRSTTRIDIGFTVVITEGGFQSHCPGNKMCITHIRSYGQCNIFPFRATRNPDVSLPKESPCSGTCIGEVIAYKRCNPICPFIISILYRGQTSVGLRSDGQTIRNKIARSRLKCNVKRFCFKAVA